MHPQDGTELERQDAFDPVASTGLFVGVSSFEDERIHAIPFAADDAVDLAHLFTLELGLILPERTVVLLAGEPQKPESIERLERLVEHGARRRSARMPDVYRYLGELTRKTEERGLFVLTVATHGVSDQGGDFLLATDSLRERTLRTGVAVAEVFGEVARAGAGRRLVLLDACRERLSQGTRGEGDSPMAQSLAQAIARATGLVVLSGATLGGFAYDDSTRKNGVFTAAVLDGLRGEAPAGSEGWITVRTLADFVQERVVEWVRRNRPDHVATSLGIGRRVEATAEALPLAPHPEVARARQQYRARREAAITRVKANQGRVISGALWDQIVAQLSADGPTPEIECLLQEIEALDGTERAQRSLRDFLRELLEGANPLTSQYEKKRKESSRAETTTPATSQIVAQKGGVYIPITEWLMKNRLRAGVVAVIVLTGFVISYLLFQKPKPAPSEPKPALKVAEPVTSDFSQIGAVEQPPSSTLQSKFHDQVEKAGEGSKADVSTKVDIPSDTKLEHNRQEPTSTPTPNTGSIASGAVDCDKFTTFPGETVLTDERIKFGYNRADLGPEVPGMLAYFIEEVLADTKLAQIEIQGHTDSLESPKDNCQLGQKRADAVRAFLVQKGVPSEKIKAISYGDNAPVGDNATSGGQAQNRRVALVVLH